MLAGAMKRRTVVALLGLVISVVAVFMVAQLVDVAATIEILKRTQPLPLLGVLGLLATSVTLRAVRWSRLLHRSDGSPIPVARLLPIMLVGYLGNIVLPARLGEVARAYLAARRESVEFSRALGTVLLERVMDVASLSIVGAVVAVAAGAPSWIVQGSLLVAAVGLAVTFALVFVGVGRAATVVERVLRWRPALADRAVAFVRNFGAGAGEQPRGALGLAFVLTTVCWVIEGMYFWLIGIAVGADLSWPVAMLAAAMTVLSTAIPSAPGYIGTYELAAVATAVALGVPSENALAVAVLAHVITSLPVAAAGGVALGRMSLSLGSLAAAAAERRGGDAPAHAPEAGA
jgi:uncharacterized protein (TIRG00374 family)